MRSSDTSLPTGVGIWFSVTCCVNDCTVRLSVRLWWRVGWIVRFDVMNRLIVFVLVIGLEIKLLMLLKLMKLKVLMVVGYVVFVKTSVNLLFWMNLDVLFWLTYSFI